MTRRLEITLSEETWAALNDARGHEPRASFVKRALGQALGGVGSGEPRTPVSVPGRGSTPRPPASARTPAMDRQSRLNAAKDKR